MKKTFLTLILSLVAVCSYAGVYRLDFTNPTIWDCESPDISESISIDSWSSFTIGSFRVSFYSTDSSYSRIGPKFYCSTNGKVHLNLYKNTTFAISSLDGSEINALELMGSSISTSSVTALKGSYTEGLWLGHSTEALLSIEGSIKLSYVYIYTDDDLPANISNSPENAYSVSEAITLIDSHSGLYNIVYVKGVVSDPSVSLSPGTANYYISDGAHSLYVHNGLYKDSSNFINTDDLQDGDTVIVCGNLTNIYDKPYELDNSYIYYTSRSSAPVTYSTSFYGIKFGSDNSLHINVQGTSHGSSSDSISVFNDSRLTGKYSETESDLGSKWRSFVYTLPNCRIAIDRNFSSSSQPSDYIRVAPGGFVVVTSLLPISEVEIQCSRGNSGSPNASWDLSYTNGNSGSLITNISYKNNSYEDKNLRITGIKVHYARTSNDTTYVDVIKEVEKIVEVEKLITVHDTITITTEDTEYIKSLENKCFLMQQRIDDLTNDLSSAKSSFNALQEQIDDLNKQIDEMKREIATSLPQVINDSESRPGVIYNLQGIQVNSIDDIRLHSFYILDGKVHFKR